MPSRLTLFRHAKSSWADPLLNDFDRPLNERGQQAAPAMGAWITAQKIRPDLVICSSALRTRQTLAAIRPHLHGNPTVRHAKALYLASAETLLKLIQATDSGMAHLMLVGHNPGLEDLAKLLIGAGPADLRAAIEAKVPSAAVIDLLFEANAWSDVAAGRGHLLAFMTPKRLAAAG